MLALAAFDAILVSMLSKISGGRHANRWQPLREDLCEALHSRKFERILAILAGLYADADVIFLQEVAASFVMDLRRSPLASVFMISAAVGDDKRDQNSVILLRKDLFVEDSVLWETAAVERILAKPGAERLLDRSSDGNVPIAPGDMLVLTARDWQQRRYLLASFHGDTNGLASIPVLRAIKELIYSDRAYSYHRLLLGLDANTYERGDAHKQDVIAFGDAYHELGLSSCWGERPDPANHTTFNARTHLQPQLNKAVSFADLGKLGVGDKNPKDFVLFDRQSYYVHRTWKDNTGEGKYNEKTVFPTLQFPSDHAIVCTELRIAEQEAKALYGR